MEIKLSLAEGEGIFSRRKSVQWKGLPQKNILTAYLPKIKTSYLTKVAHQQSSYASVWPR